VLPQFAPASQNSAGARTADAVDLPVLKTRILCAGDSITHGVNGYTSYRYPLWFRLFPLKSVVDFVGTRYTVHQENGTTIPDLNQFNRYYTHFDRDHQGYNGMRTDHILPWLPQAVATTRPNLVILMIGTNDIGQMGSYGVDHALDGIDAIVFAIRQQVPTTSFLIATLPPIGVGTSYFFQAPSIDTFNALLPAHVANLDTPLSRAMCVDVHAALDLATDMQPDGLHPNALGQEKIADVLYPYVLSAMRGSYRPVAQPAIQIFDTGFESLGLADGVYSQSPLNDWRYPMVPHIIAGTWNPDEVSYTGAAGSGTPLGAEGDEVLSLENSGGDPALGWVYQLLGTTLEMGTTYQLDVSIGHRLPTTTRGTGDWGGYWVELMAGSQTIASATNQVSPAPGSFALQTLTVDSSNIDPSLLGAAMTVRVRLVDSLAGSATDFDGIQLTKY